MFLAGLFFGLIPIKLRQAIITNPKISKRNADIGLSCCLCFGAGVLLATVFLHISPEAKEAFDELTDSGKIKQIDYPISEFTLCLGFFLIYFIEEIAHWLLHKHSAKSKQESQNNRDSFSIVTINNKLNHSKEVEYESKITHPKEYDSESVTSNEASEQSLSTNDKLKILSLRTILIVFALSLHGCFEGLELGLENTSFGVWSFCLAICLHKIFIAFSMGMELIEVGVTRNVFYIYIICFAMAAPLGSIFGLLLYNNINSGNVAGVIAIAVLKAISGGAILFVVFCEVLERERQKADGKTFHFIGLIVGFAAMASLQIIHDPHSKDPHSTEGENATFQSVTFPRL